MSSVLEQESSESKAGPGGSAAGGPVSRPTVKQSTTDSPGRETGGSLLDSPDQVLSTLNRDGSRRWLRPLVSRGRFLTARRVVAYALIALFVLLPFWKINGKPAILLDILKREFSLFGVTFLPTDTVLLALLLISSVLAIFLVTALLGRIWCGWACPQTVYMEFLYRPLERLFNGPPNRQGRATKPGPLRTGLKYATYVLVSFLLANLFLAYFVGVDALKVWVTRSPLEHPTSFLVMAITTGLMLIDFCWFREQTCIVACPYGRLQSVLLDRHSLIISYDERRGEPRGKLSKSASVELPVMSQSDAPSSRGDCVDCGLCVVTCPTGIDIRNGLQLECVACAQCIDACDAVMDKIGRPRGLIRYGSQAEMLREPRRLLRPRVILYPLILAGLLGALTFLLITKAPADISLLRGRGMPFAELADRRISNQLQVKITNRTRNEAEYSLSLVVPSDGELNVSENPMHVAAGATRTDGLAIIAPRTAFNHGRCEAIVRISDGHGFERDVRFTLVGP